jgi:hypothetical protein
VRSIRLHLTIQGQPSAAVYTTLATIGRDLHCRARASHFVVSASADAGTGDGWESHFRCGVLQWFKEDSSSFGRASDIALFEGSWSCVDDGDDTAVTFAARLDIGIPHPAVETAAVRAFIDDAVVILACLFDGNVRVDDVVIQAHEPLAFSMA